MSVSLGSIFVKLDAETTSFLKGVAGATKSMERFAKEVKRAANDIAQVGGTLTALGAGALALASTVDGRTKSALDGMKQASTGLAVEIARTLLPAVQEITTWIRGLADWFAGLSPHTKALISSFAVFAAQAALVAKALSLVSTLAGGTAGAISSLVKAVAGVGVGPLMGIALAVGAVIAAVLVLHKAWRENWGGIQQHAKAFLEWFQSGFSTVFGKLGEWLNAVTLRFLDFVDEITTAMQAFFESVGADGMASLAKSAKEMIRTFRADVQSKGLGGVVKGIVEDMAETGKAGGAALKEEFELVMKELGVDKLFDFQKGASHSGRAGSLTGFSEKVTGRNAPGVVSASEGSILQMASHAQRSAPGQRINQTSVAKNAEGAMEAAKEWWGGISDASSPALAQFAGRMKIFWDESAALLGQAIMSGVNKLTSMLGDMGDLIQAGIQGFQTGGIWGALIAMILELLSKFERWGEVLDAAQAAFGKLMDDLRTGLGSIVDAFLMLIDSVQPLANLLHKVINPILQIIGTGLQALGAIIQIITALLEPILNLLAGVFQGINKVIQPITSSLQTLADVLSPIISMLGSLLNVLVPLEPVFKLIGWVISIVALSILGTVNVIGLIVNAIANEYVIDVNKIQNQMRKIWEDMGKFDATTLDPVGTSAKVVTENFNELSKTTKDLMGSLTNVPDWYKVAQARFAATSGGDWEVGSLAKGGRGQTIIFNGPVTIESNDPRKFGEVLQRESFRQTGSRYAGALGTS